MKVIIYPQENNSIAIVTPTGELPIEDVALKDVPKDTPFFIIDSEILPEDYEFFDAWEADFSNPHGYGLGVEEYWKRKVTNDNY